MQLNRLFFALMPPPEVREALALAARQLRIRAQPAGRAEPAEKLHLTLQFLGNAVAPAQQADLQAVAAAVRAAPFTMTLDHASCFKGARGPWWLGLQTPPPALFDLQERLRQATQRVGVAPERQRFVPHVTVQRDAGVSLAPTPITPIAWPVTEFCLLRSRLDRQPADYETLGCWALSGAETPGPTDQMTLW